MIYYKNNEIIIRDVINSDVITLFSWSIDQEINKHDPKPLPKNTKSLMKECENYCRRFEDEIISSPIEKRKYKYFIIEDAEGRSIGFVNFFSVDKEKKQGEMGVLIGDKRYWQRGIGYASVKAVIDYIFNHMDIERIYIETGENNIPAINLFSKLHFNKCGEYLEDEDFKFIVMEKKK